MLSEDAKLRTRPHWHYNHIPDDILPALRKAGVKEDQNRADARAESPGDLRADEEGVKRLVLGVVLLFALAALEARAEPTGSALPGSSPTTRS